LLSLRAKVFGIKAAVNKDGLFAEILGRINIAIEKPDTPMKPQEFMGMPFNYFSKFQADNETWYSKSKLGRGGQGRATS
jgi:hypothetical protein